METTYTILRIIDVCLYFVVMVGFWRLRNWFWAATTQERMMKVGLGLLMLTGMYSSLEILLTGVPGGPRVFVVSVPLLFLAVGSHVDVVLKIRNWLRGKRGRWQLWAHVMSFHDGDTWYGYVDLSAHFYIGTNDRPVRFRCARIQAPELSTGKPGADATDYATKLAPPGDYPCTSTGLDNYGRPIVDLHLPDGRLFSEAMLAAGQAVSYR